MNKIVIGAIIVALAIVGIYFFAPEPKVDVKIYKHLESGNFIYCETGELTGDAHEYIGTGKIAESKAVAC